jgi:hypothetical protein
VRKTVTAAIGYDSTGGRPVAACPPPA